MSYSPQSNLSKVSFHIIVCVHKWAYLNVCVVTITVGNRFRICAKCHFVTAGHHAANKSRHTHGATHNKVKQKHSWLVQTPDNWFCSRINILFNASTVCVQVVFIMFIHFSVHIWCVTFGAPWGLKLSFWLKSNNCVKNPPHSLKEPA